MDKAALPRRWIKLRKKVTRKMVRKLIAAKKKAGLSQSSIRNILAPIARVCITNAIEDDDTQRNPPSRMGKFNKREGGKRTINPLTLERLKSCWTRRRPILHTTIPSSSARRSGLREGELITPQGN